MSKAFFTADWFPYYHERFEDSDSVALMSAAEEGGYHRAIRWAWKKRSLPNSVEVFAAKIRCSIKVTEKILKTFVTDPDNPTRVIHPVVEEIRDEQEQKYLNRRKGGKASAKARQKEVSVNGENKGELNNTQYCSNNTPTRIENRDKREEELRGATASPSEPDKPDDAPPPADPRKAHPAIVAIHATVGIYPPKEIWDDLIDRMGFEVDVGKLKDTYTKWRARGYNKTNYDGFIDWYTNGIPKAGQGNGSANKSYREKRVEEVRQSAAIERNLRERRAERKRQLQGGSVPDNSRLLSAVEPEPDG